MKTWEIDLFSDTKTRPSAGMRAAMAAAEVGDEQQDEDPTVATLNRRVAEMLGKAAAVFVPSGTMANVASILVHCRRGDEILAEATSHVVNLETGGAAGLAGASIVAIEGHGGLYDVSALSKVIRAPRRNAPRPRLVWIEQTTNLGGGRVWPIDTLKAVSGWAATNGLAVHIDGARLLNAATAHGVDPHAYGAVADSLWLDFSKGLGAPFGAVLVGSTAFIEEARRYKHMLGGAMRQAGTMAAACLYALDHNVTRLADDHRLAGRLAEGLAVLDGLTIVGQVETNIVLIDTGTNAASAPLLAERLARLGVRIGVFGERRLRLITHLDISATDVERAIVAFGEALGTAA